MKSKKLKINVEGKKGKKKYEIFFKGKKKIKCPLAN